MKILRSPIPYMGNKYKLLEDLLQLFPKECDTFIDLFGGSGVVSMNYQGRTRTVYNEFNENIVELVKMFRDNDPKDLNKYFESQIEKYGLERMSLSQQDRITREGYARRQENFTRLRDDYNNSKERDYRDLYLLCKYSINNLIRFNSDNEFNVSSGADAYGDVHFDMIKCMHDKFNTVEIICGNAFDFDFDSLTSNDFLYCDPPYSNTDAVYNEKRAFGGWGIEEDNKLFKILEQLDSKGVKWGLSNVFENRDAVNQHLIDWCNEKGWYVTHLYRNYNPFSRGNSESDEVYVCNYKPNVPQVKITNLW